MQGILSLGVLHIQVGLTNNLLFICSCFTFSICYWAYYCNSSIIIYWD